MIILVSSLVAAVSVAVTPIPASVSVATDTTVITDTGVAAQSIFDMSADAKALLRDITLTVDQQKVVDKCNADFKDLPGVFGTGNSDIDLKRVGARRRQIGIRAILEEPQRVIFDGNVKKMVEAAGRSR